MFQRVRYYSGVKRDKYRPNIFYDGRSVAPNQLAGAIKVYANDYSNLYFNLGRLYIDWKRYDKAEKAAKIALNLNPEFIEAQKMLAFAKRKQENTC